jgi:hypothetical protein
MSILNPSNEDHCEALLRILLASPSSDILVMIDGDLLNYLQAYPDAEKCWLNNKDWLLDQFATIRLAATQQKRTELRRRYLLAKLRNCLWLYAERQSTYKFGYLLVQSSLERLLAQLKWLEADRDADMLRELLLR